ncbi:hypothetical protein CIL05_04840 [Virgibacillus profundi]|uniref:Nitrous oxide reductase accessory protein NosL n=1 Tax=Virgibacillus profundi TaxID=2024555 RepID=A0A2A2II46_9BACI|nr:nitrous oxide reductase accessory protein NosL [Virgibacillus profundi]PAV31038.1 hypothetical protein CIL05_04840 [Virgibacillus profundi]PXY55224.1 hypothetical protein CIT14_04925 [Virgibacillus profundi]
MKKKIIPIILLMMIGLLASCGETSYDPAEISMESDQCHTCYMGIEDLEAASQTLLADGTPRIFDDIGCMLMYLQDTTDDVEVSYVVDYNSGDWNDLSNAYFVHDESIQTPMSYGFIAFSSEQEAEEYMTASGQGNLFTSDEITAIDTASLEEWYRGHSEERHGEDEEHEDDGNDA